jgi:hypothetical protein
MEAWKNFKVPGARQCCLFFFLFGRIDICGMYKTRLSSVGLSYLVRSLSACPSLLQSREKKSPGHRGCDCGDVSFVTCFRKCLSSPSRRTQRLQINIYFSVKVKVTYTLVQALRLCTDRTANRGSRGIVVLYRY